MRVESASYFLVLKAACLRRINIPFAVPAFIVNGFFLKLNKPPVSRRIDYLGCFMIFAATALLIAYAEHRLPDPNSKLCVSPRVVV